jgi:transcriptional regulator with XRE-family HTH domain
MSDLARILGTHASEISRLERGLRDPRLSTVVRLARALDVPVAALVDGIDALSASVCDPAVVSARRGDQMRSPSR